MTGVLIHTADEAEWLAARRTGVTASEIAVLMGLSPWDSPYALFHRKLGNLPEQDQDVAMGLGEYMESYVAERFADRYPDFYLPGDGRRLYAHPARGWQMATPDRLVYEFADPCGGAPDCPHLPEMTAVLECKIDGGSDGWGEDGSDEIPVHYRCQVLWQMDVLGVTTGFVACLLWHRREVRVYELQINGASNHDLDIMRIEAQLFLDRIETGREPSIDWRPATRAALKHLYPGVEDVDVPVRRMPIIQYRAACKAFKAAEQRKKLAENRLRELLGNGRRITSAHTGEVIARREVFDRKAYQVKAGRVDRLVSVNPKDTP